MMGPGMGLGPGYNPNPFSPSTSGGGASSIWQQARYIYNRKMSEIKMDDPDAGSDDPDAAPPSIDGGLDVSG